MRVPLGKETLSANRKEVDAGDAYAAWSKYLEPASKVDPP
jgi:hypothetical protein